MSLFNLLVNILIFLNILAMVTNVKHVLVVHSSCTYEFNIKNLFKKLLKPANV